jgi:hypothetical protein
VTSCSRTQGAAVCRALLHANAFVLGTDREVPHASTQSSRASHFQFLRSSALDVDAGEAVLNAVGYHFKEGPPDFLVDVVGEMDGNGELGRIKAVLNGMSVRGKGLVLNVVDGEGEEEIVSFPPLGFVVILFFVWCPNTEGGWLMGLSKVCRDLVLRRPSNFIL